MFVVMTRRRQRGGDPRRQEPDPRRGSDAVRPRQRRSDDGGRRRRDRGAPAGAARALRDPPRRRVGHADQPSVQADLARVPPGGHGHPRPRRGHRRRVADDDGRAVLGREPRAAVRDGRRGEGGRRHDPARRRVQAADLAVRLPGARHRRPPPPRRGARADRPAGHHRGHGAEPGRHRRRVRRHPPDRHAEHAELLAAARRRAGSPGR